MDRACLTRFLLFLLMVLGSLAEWVALIHFNLIDSGWAYWRGGVIVAVIFALAVYRRAKEGDVPLLNAMLICMALPWVFGAIIIAGYLFIFWRIPDFNYFSFSEFGLMQIAGAAIGAFFIILTM